MPKNLEELVEHIHYLNYAWLRKQGIRLKMKNEKKYQKKYFVELLKERRN